MTTLTVGAGLQFGTVAQAVAASHDGDVILIEAGTYKNDFVQINDSVTLCAVGGMATIQATVPPSNLKGIITVGDGSHAPDVTLEGLVLTGATISAAEGNNAAGIRYQSGTLTLDNDIVRGNQDGLLATPEVANQGTIIVNASTFAANGAGDGYSHNLYIGHVAQFTFEDSVSTGAILGHDIKSRALNTAILDSTISDGPTATTSYEIDLPNGGNALIQGNTIEQGPKSANPVIISYGEEGGVPAGSTLVVTGNTILNDLTAHVPTGVRNTTTLVASVSDNQYYGLTSGQLVSGPAVVTNNTSLAAAPTTVSQTTISQTTTISQDGTLAHTGSAFASVLITGGHDTLVAGAGGVSVVATGTVACVSTLAGVSDTLDLRNSGTVFSAGHDSITTAGTIWVVATGQDTIHAGAGRTDLTGRPGGTSTVVGGTGGFIYAGQGGALNYTGGSGTALITAGTGAAMIRFGTGATTLTLGTGGAQLIFTQGQTSSDTIQGFDPTRDTITYQGFTGSAVASQTTSAGTTWLTLTDGTKLTFTGGSAPPPPS